MDTEHEIELVLRFYTNLDQSELDDLLCGASETIFADFRGEADDVPYSVYIPEGSHWRDVTPYPGAKRPWWRGRIEANGWDPSASSLPGGNQLGPGRKPTPVPE